MPSLFSLKPQRYCPLWQSNMVGIVSQQKFEVPATGLLQSSDFIKPGFLWWHKRRNKVSKKWVSAGVTGNKSSHTTYLSFSFYKQLAAVADFSFSFCLEAPQWQRRTPFWCTGWNERDRQGRKEGRNKEKEWVNRWMSEGGLWVSDSLTVDRLAL